MPTYLRLKHTGTGNPADFAPITYRPGLGRDWPSDRKYGLSSTPQLTFSPDGRVNSAVYGLQVEMADLIRMIPHILGFSTYIAGSPVLQWKLPLNDPDRFGMTAVAIEPATYFAPSGYNPLTGTVNGYFQRLTTDDPSAAPGEAQKMYRWANMQVRFVHLPYLMKPDVELARDERERFCSSLTTVSSEYVQLDKSVIFWDETDAGGPTVGDPVATGGGIIRAYSEIVTTWHRIPFNAYARLIRKWREYLSTVNTATLTLPFFDQMVEHEAGCMLFQPWRSRERIGPDGYPEYDVELRWLYRNNGTLAVPKGWNTFLYPPTGRYYRVVWGESAVTATSPIYPVKDHDQIFNCT